MKPLIENWNKFVNENEGGDVEAAMRAGEKEAAETEIPDEAIEKTGKSPEELLDDVENAKQQLLSLVTTVSEDEAYSKIKNLMLTPLEDKTTAEKRELIGMALRNLGVTTIFLGVPALFAGWLIGAATVGIAVSFILAWLGSTLERRAQIEQGKDVPVMSAGGESEGGRARYTPEKVAQMKALQERNKTKMTKARLKEIIKEELGNALNEEGVSPKELGLPLDVGTPEKLLQGLSVLLNNPEQIQKDQIGYILNLINKQLMKNPDEATGDALRNAKTKLIDLDPARSSMASSRASRRDKFRDEAESAYAAPAGGDFYSTGGARFEGKTKLTNSHLKLIVKEELEALLGEEEKFLQNIKSTGEWTDYTIGELEKKRDALRKKEKRTAAQTKDLRQINFAINAKQGDYEKK